MVHFKKHVINFEFEKEPKMRFFDFGAFQIIFQMISHGKIMLFGGISLYFSYFVMTGHVAITLRTVHDLSDVT